MRKLLAFFSVAGVAALAFGVTVDVVSFNRACPFTLSGYRGASTLVDFPVAVRLSENITGFRYSDCAANGADLRFADAAGNLIPHEVESWDPSGESIVWVKVPALSGTDTGILLYYGQKEGATLPAVDSREVWTKFVAVVHGGADLHDSSPKQVAVANGGGVTPTMTSGVIGGGVNKPVRNSIGVNVANPIKNGILTDTTRFTLSAWFKFTSTGTDCIVASKKAWGGTGFLLLCQAGNYMSCAVASTHQPGSTNGKGRLVQNQWSHVGFSYVATGDLRTYFDDACIYSLSTAKALGDENLDFWTFGSYGMTASGDSHSGDIDEMRIYDGIATADWMQAEYDSIAVAAFAAPGAAMDVSAGRLPNAAVVSDIRSTAAGIVVSGAVSQIRDGATSLDLVIRWGDTEALAGGVVAVGTFTEVGQTFTATIPATQMGGTYFYRLEMAPGEGPADLSEIDSKIFSGIGATWRPQSADATWRSTAWQLGGTLFDFGAKWSAIFDGAEVPFIETINLPDAIVADVVTVTGAKNYAIAGTGKIAASKFVKSGAGVLTTMVERFAEPINIDVAEGTLNATGTVFFATTPAGVSSLTVGGGDAPAQFLMDHIDATFGRDNGSEAVVSVRRNGLIYNESAQWIRLGGGPGAHCQVTIEQGGEIDGNYVMIGSMAAVGEARVAGTLTVRGNVLGVGEGSNSSLTLLPGGRVRARGAQAWNNSSTWGSYTGTSTIHVDDGTFELYPVAAYANTTPILNTLVPVTYENAITFDIPTGGSTFCRAPLRNVTENGTARFVKTGGGLLTYSADPAGISGVIDVQAGELVFSPAIAEEADIQLKVAPNAAIGFDEAGGWAKVLKHLPKDSACGLMLFASNKDETIDISEYPNLRVILTMGTFTGKIITADNHLVLDLAGRALVFDSELADVAGHPAKLTVMDSVGGSIVHVKSVNSSMTGGATVKNGVTLAMYGPEGNAFALGPTGPVKLESGSILQLDAKSIDPNFIRNRVTDDSDPAFIFVQNYAAACNVDVSRFPNCRVGINGGTSCSMTGALTPYGNTYLLGGGNTAYASSNTGLKPGVMADVDLDTPRSVVVDRPGLINLSDPANSYSGGTVVTNGGCVYIAGNDGFGKAPDSFDAYNVLINGGVLRQGSANTTLAATRGIWVGDEGMVYHPWGGYTLTVPGGLGGTGDITVTDSGHLTLTGENNTWNGHLTFNNQSVFTIGDGEHFSWASTGGIDTKNASSTLILKTDSDTATFADTYTGVGALRKEGDGVLTLSAASQATGRATVADGTLRLTGSAALASASAIVNNGEILVERSGTATDIFGVQPIFGSGVVRFPDAGDVTIDRSLSGLRLLEVAAGHTATFTVPAPDTEISLTDGASVKLAATTTSGFDDFVFNGKATKIASDEIQLTSASPTYQAGTAYWRQRIDLAQPWEARFVFKAVNPPAQPADGFTFVIQCAGENAMGANGGKLAVDTVKPSFGVGFNHWGGTSIGWIENGARVGFVTALDGITLLANPEITVAYDGFGTVKTVVTEGDRVYSQERNVNLRDYLGNAMAWIGFTGGTGGAVCDQRICDFHFTQGGAKAAPELAPSNDSRWQLNSSAVYEEVDGKPMFCLTPAANYVTGSVVRTERIYTGRPFTIRGKYRYDSCTSAAPADGAAIFLQNNGLTACGAYGGSVGVSGISTAIGWKLNIYNSNSLAPVKSGAIGTAVASSVDFRNAQETDFILSYRPGVLTLTVAQGETSHTVTQEVNLSDYFGAPGMYFSASGGTGAYNAKQYVYDFSMQYDDEAGSTEFGGGYGSLVCEGASTVEVAADAAKTVEVGTLALGANAVVNVVGEGAADTPYTLTARRIAYDGAHSKHVLTLAANGSAAGTLRLGTVVYDGMRNGDWLKITGAVAPLDGTIKIDIPEVKGLVKLMDLSAATGVTLEDFAFTAEETKMELRLANGILYALRDVSTVLFFR